MMIDRYSEKALSEGKRAELIDGRMYETASPGRIHQRLLVALLRLIANYIEDRDGSCEVYAAPFAVYINKKFFKTS
ncbi:MAG: Uma2 family endonuclease [Lachnospiraceae bacterium]